MLINSNDIRKFNLHCIDGEIGHVKDLLFDTEHWAIRYLVVDTGGWLVDRRVLISPHAIKSVSEASHVIDVNLRKKQIEESPPLEGDNQIDAQFERDYHGYYGWPVYWGGPFMWGFSYTPASAMGLFRVGEPRADIPKEPDIRSSLRVTSEVIGSSIQANDGEFGQVDDFIVDDQAWAIRYMVIDTSKWWPGKKILLCPKWVDEVSWSNKKVYISIDRDKINGAPDYDPDLAITREYESTLCDYYERKGYWA